MISRLGLEVLKEGLDDWVPFAAVKGAARRLGAASEAEARRRTADAVRELANQGLVEIGEVSQSGFSPWRGRLSELLAGLDADADADDVDFSYWLSNTALGDERAQSA
jgi:hypothetical protein